MKGHPAIGCLSVITIGDESFPEDIDHRYSARPAFALRSAAAVPQHGR